MFHFRSTSRIHRCSKSYVFKIRWNFHFFRSLFLIPESADSSFDSVETNEYVALFTLRINQNCFKIRNNLHEKKKRIGVIIKTFPTILDFLKIVEILETNIFKSKYRLICMRIVFVIFFRNCSFFCFDQTSKTTNIGIIKMKLLKYGVDMVVSFIQVLFNKRELFNKIQRGAAIPREWNVLYMSSIFKKD